VEGHSGAIVNKIKTSRFDVADHLDSDEVIVEYLNAALEAGDPDLLMSAIADVAKARGIARVAEDAGLGRESLYKTLKPGAKPQLATVFKILHALGIKLSATTEPAHA
jgi:probable addiction module antidote protein